MVDAFSTSFSNILLRVSLPAAASCLVLVGLEAALVSESFDVAIEGEVSRTVDLYFNPLSWAPYQSPKVTAVWIPEVGEPQTSSVPFSVVKPVAETKSGHRFAATTGTADAKARATEAFAIIRREHLWRTSCIDC